MSLRRLFSPPRGRGLLSAILTDGISLRLADFASDPRSIGFPPGHPPMRGLLAVPLIHAGRILGNLCLTEKVGADAFSEEDERLLTMLAGQAAAVIEQARLAGQVRTLAVTAERDTLAATNGDDQTGPGDDSAHPERRDHRCRDRDQTSRAAEHAGELELASSHLPHQEPRAETLSPDHRPDNGRDTDARP